MAKIKYNPTAIQLFGNHNGQCFQNSSKGSIIKNNAHMRSFRTPNQKEISGYFISGSSHWRNLGSISQAAWQSFVEFLPQPQIRDNTQSLTAYENFVKRNTYLQITEANENVWMSEPVLVEYSKDTLSTLALVSATNIALSCEFVNQDSNLDCLLFLSGIQSPGKTYIETVYRYMATIANFNQQIDITVPFIQNFGILPQTGSKLFFTVIFCGRDNGQFWFPEKTSLIGEAFPPPFFPVKFGILYNNYACVDSRKISSSDDWDLMTWIQNSAYLSFLGDFANRGGRMKETSFDYWNSPNSGAVNDVFFNGRAAGWRNASAGGIYSDFMTVSQHWLKDGVFAGWYGNYRLRHNSSICDQASGTGGIALRYGYQTRLVRSSTPLAEGEFGSYTGNDDKLYETFVINGLEIMIHDLCETKFRTGEDIPSGFSDSAYAALTSSAWSPPNGNIVNI